MAGNKFIVDDSAHAQQELRAGVISSCIPDADNSSHLSPASAPFDLVLSDIDLEESAKNTNPITN